MKKITRWLASIMAVLALTTFVGCTEQQVTVAAHNAGLASVAAWYYSSDEVPTAEVKGIVTDLVTLIGSSASEVSAGASYTQVLTPKVDIWVSENVPEKDRLAVRLASGWVLMGIDSLFALNPSFAEKEETVLKAVEAYCGGATLGLSMTKDAPLMKALEPARQARTLIR